MGDHRRLMRGLGADGEQPAVNARMQRLEASVHHFGEFGELGDVHHGDASLGERGGRAAGRDDLDSARRQRPTQLDKAGLVGNGDQSAADGRNVSGHGEGLEG